MDDLVNKKKRVEYLIKKDSSILKIESAAVIRRRKVLILEDQLKSNLAWELNRNHRQVGKLSCRNPFKVDEALINYTLDSEDEWAEENGEDLDSKKGASDEEEDEEDDASQASFIVDDGYLSLTEMIDSDADDTRDRLEERRRVLI